jgi:hypothetical protein
MTDPIEQAKVRAGFLDAIAGDCDEGENNAWEDHEWADVALTLREAAALMRQLIAQIEGPTPR